MGTGYHSPGSGNARYTTSERKPPFNERSDAHLLVREAAQEVAEEYHDDAPDGETHPDGEHIQTSLRGWGTPLREGTVGGSPAEHRMGSSGAGGNGAAGTVMVGHVGSAARTAQAADASGIESAVGAVALAERENSAVLDEQISDLQGLGEGRLDALHEAGYQTPADVLQASIEELTNIESIGEAVAERVQETVHDEYDRPEQAIDYGLGLGEGTTPQDLPEWGQQFVDDVDEETRDAIGDTDFEIMTHQGPDDSILFLDSTQLDEIEDDEDREAVEYVEGLYQSSAAKMAANARNDETAQRIFKNVARGTTRIPQDSGAVPSHRQTDEGSHLQIPNNGVELDLMHELGHATTYAHGYDIAPRGRESLERYGELSSRENPDPYVEVDYEDPALLLSQENGEEIEGVSEEFETLIDRTNDAFQRIHQAAEREGDHEQYLAGLNYSGLSATEFFGVFHSYMQADERTADEHPTQGRLEFEGAIAEMLFYQPEVAKAYFEVFEPADLPAETVRDLRDNPAMDSPYDEYELPSKRDDPPDR